MWAVICCSGVYVLTEIHSGPEAGFQEVTIIEAFVVQAPVFQTAAAELDVLTTIVNVRHAHTNPK